VLGAIGFGTAIVVGAALAFLGLGPTNSVLNWGALINSGQQYVDRDWWITTFPGIVLTLVVIAVNIVGDWIRDRMEPSSR
jgi:peptide/nickel transport system permease protein